MLEYREVRSQSAENLPQVSFISAALFNSKAAVGHASNETGLKSMAFIQEANKHRLGYL